MTSNNLDSETLFFRNWPLIWDTYMSAMSSLTLSHLTNNFIGKIEAGLTSGGYHSPLHPSQ